MAAFSVRELLEGLLPVAAAEVDRNARAALRIDRREKRERVDEHRPQRTAFDRAEERFPLDVSCAVPVGGHLTIRSERRMGVNPNA